MWNPVAEKNNMLSEVGDFWYKVLSEGDIPTAHRLTHLPLQSRILRQAESICSMFTTGGHFKDNFLLIKFKDADVIWYGKEDALQHQHNVGRLPDGTSGNSRVLDLSIPDHTFLSSETEELLGVPYHAAALPDIGEDMSFASNSRLQYGLKVNPNIRVTSIQKKDGKMLYEFQDFESEYGLIRFYSNPISLFPQMELMAYSYDLRARNIYCYPLGVDVYGPVDRILHYVRIGQSPKSLHLAAAQAAGLPVVKKDCEISAVEKLHDGVIYYTTTGDKYDADFPHTHLPVGERLKEESIIAGDQLFKLITPGDPVPNSLPYINPDFALPVKGLRIPNKTIVIRSSTTSLRPAFEGSTEALEKYYAWLQRYDGQDYSQLPTEMNGIAFAERYLCCNRAVIACVNIHQMPGGMYLRLISFLRRELPLGSVLFTAPLPVVLKEENPVQSG